VRLGTVGSALAGVEDRRAANGELQIKSPMNMIGYYKDIRETVQEGRLYRLFSPREGTLTANQYVAEDGRQAVLFAFLQDQQFLRPVPAIRLRGLDERALYKVESVNNKLVEREAQFSGAYLMRAGLNVNLRGDFDGTAIILERQ